MPDELPTAPELRDALLDALRHEGDQGLWEVVWTLNHDAPNAPLADKIALAREVVFGLVADRVADLWRIEWPSTDGRLLTSDETSRLPAEDPPWFAPDETNLMVEVRLRDVP